MGVGNVAHFFLVSHPTFAGRQMQWLWSLTHETPMVLRVDQTQSVVWQSDPAQWRTIIGRHHGIIRHRKSLFGLEESPNHPPAVFVPAAGQTKVCAEDDAVREAHEEGTCGFSIGGEVVKHFHTGCEI